MLGFTANQLNILLIAAYVLLYLGIMAYKYYFIKYSWRTVYIVTTLLNGFFSFLQILLITGNTFGLSPFLFALGDDAFADFIGGIQFLVRVTQRLFFFRKFNHSNVSRVRALNTAYHYHDGSFVSHWK